MSDTTTLNLKPGQEIRIRVTLDGLVADLYTRGTDVPDGIITAPVGNTITVKEFIS